MKRTFTIFAGTLIALGMAVNAVSFDVTEKPSDTFVVPKTVVSSTMRLVIEVGLEGSGHHTFAQVLDHMFETNPNLVQIADEHDDTVGDFYTINYSMGQTAQHYGKTLSLGREKMRILAQRGGTLAFPGTVVYTHGVHRYHSYPSGTGPNKALKYLDLRVLAEVAEDEGVDLRVLYLRRPVKDIIIANTIHRGFQTGLQNSGPSTPEDKFMQYMQILLTEIAVVHSLLAELDPGFVVCHEFEQLGSVDQSNAISDFLAPNENLAALLRESFNETEIAPRAPSTEALRYEGADDIAARLQRKFDAFESQLCPGTRID